MNTHSSNEPLSSREKEILKLLVNGNTTKQIATALHISPHTVNAHRKNIMRKLDIKTVSGLTIYAVLNNIITLKEA
ncbi:MAG: LuxR C-terminal-related transcriptional regulator [Chitinophagales bacterium]|nr:LuxR C-terminal-related transcriptional regulator [Chitinophagales bacterium]